MIDFMRSVAVEAGEIFQRPQSILSRKEGGGNYTTEVDVVMQRHIIRRIREEFPRAVIIAEENEACSQTPHELNKLEVFIIDPLDGTTNAKNGLPIYGPSIARMKNGVVTHGVILDIARKRLYSAEQGKGAFSGDGKQLRVTDSGLRDQIVFFGSPYSDEDFVENENLRSKVKASGARLETLGSSVIESAYVAEGVAALYYEVGLKPWDVAAAKILVEEAGGIVRGRDGELDIFAPHTYIAGSQLAVDEFLELARQ